MKVSETQNVRFNLNEWYSGYLTDDAPDIVSDRVYLLPLFVKVNPLKCMRTHKDRNSYN